MRLRGPLARWEASLALFSPTFRGALGPWLGPLRLALGPQPGRARPGGGEPDGYDGLSRRGPPERLLMGDWLLAEEAPDEFLRRAAEGELGYLRLARIEPVGARRCVALFDVGPELLGAPRLALVALLVCLARRAEAAGALLLLGALQGEECFRGGALKPAAVRRLLLTGAAARGDGEMLEGWRDRLTLTGEDELWLLGSEGTASRLAGAGAGMVSVADTLEVEAALEVSVRRPGRHVGKPRSVRLALPGTGDCAAALRDPFERAPAGRRAAESVGGELDAIVLSSSGRRLVLVSSTGVLTTVQISDAPGSLAVRAVATEPAIVAVGWWRSSVIRLRCSEQKLSLGGSPYHPKGRRAIAWEPPLVLPPDGRYLSMLIHRSWFESGYDLELWLLDRARQLLKIRLHDDGVTTPIRLRAEEVYGMARTGLGATFVGRISEAAALETGGVQVWNDSHHTFLLAGPGGPAVPEVFFGCPDKRTGDGLLVALEQADSWVVHCAGRTVTLEAGEGRVVGVAMDGCWPDPGPALAVLEGTELSLRGLRGRRVITRDVAPTLDPVFATLEPRAAWMNSEGRLVVFQLEENRVWAEVGL